MPYEKEMAEDFIYELEINQDSEMSSDNQDLTLAAATKISFFPAQTQSLAEPEHEHEHEHEHTLNFDTTKKNLNDDALEIIDLSQTPALNTETQKVVVKNSSGKIEPLLMIERHSDDINDK